MSHKTNKTAPVLGTAAAEVQPQNLATTTPATPNDEAPKVSKVVKSSDKKKFLQPLLTEGISPKDLVEALKAQFPQMTEVTIKTLVVDLKNEKYSVFKEQKVVKTEDGKIKFAA